MLAKINMRTKRRGSGGMVMITVTLLAGACLSILYVFATSTFTSSTVTSLGRAEAHIILSDVQTPSSGNNDVYCQDFTSMLISNGIIGSANDVVGNCSWTIAYNGTLPDGTPKLVATLNIPDMNIKGTVVNYLPVSAYRED